jgi:tRNA modification GTPase
MSLSAFSVELLTPPGAGGVAVLCVRGAGAIARLRGLSRAGIPGPGEVRLAILREPGSAPDEPPLDEALLVGRSQWVEVHTHGSPSIVSAVVDLLTDPPRGAESTGGIGTVTTPADVGERPSLEERAERAAATTPSATGARVLLDQAGGALRQELAQLVDAEPGERKRRLAALASEGGRCARLWAPAVVAIIGPVNAGKSTLFNALLGEEQATVTARPGTTRDALGAPAELGGWPVILVDTAGERDLAGRVAQGDPGASVEAEGQRLARGVASRADLVLELSPAGSERWAAGPLSGAPPSGDPPGGDPPGGDPPSGDPVRRGPASRRLHLWSRAAEQAGPSPAGWGSLGISALEDPAHARESIGDLFIEHLGLGGRPSWVAGRPVPFEPELVQRLCDLATAETADGSALASLLASL